MLPTDLRSPTGDQAEVEKGRKMDEEGKSKCSPGEADGHAAGC